ncbi:MAG: cysteine desulfurase NifS [Candidatus Hydrogenedentota bacterium]
MDRVIYLDNNATTKVAEEVRDAILPFLNDKYGNPSSMHYIGAEAASAVENAREQVASLINADPLEIVFTGCGTESDNFAIQGILKAYPQKRHIVTTKVEHPAVLEQCKELKRLGYNVTFLGVDENGLLDIEEYKNSIRDDTAIVSIMWANNETGVIFPVKELADIAKKRGTIFHTDAIQAASKITIDMSSNSIDLLSISGHKFHAPKGIGVLYIRKDTKIRNLLIGGHQERGRRAGTENLTGIVGIGEACKLAKQNMNEEIIYITKLRDRLQQGILQKIPKVRINGALDKRLPNTLNVSFEGVEGESVLLLLSEDGICASTGSACTSGSLEPSHVLKTMKISEMLAFGVIRFSLSRYNTEEEIDYTLSVLPGIIEKLRKISPYWKG